MFVVKADDLSSISGAHIVKKMLLIICLQTFTGTHAHARVHTQYVKVVFKMLLHLFI